MITLPFSTFHPLISIFGVPVQIQLVEVARAEWIALKLLFRPTVFGDEWTLSRLLLQRQLLPVVISKARDFSGGLHLLFSEPGTNSKVNSEVSSLG